jgi:small subunit ribosomal protein S17
MEIKMSKRQLTGTVVSDKMEKTVVVEVETKKRHPVYHKVVKRKKRFSAHDDLGAKTGDCVVIEETRPISKTKKWKVTEIRNPKSE